MASAMDFPRGRSFSDSSSAFVMWTTPSCCGTASAADGSLAGPFGKVGAELTVEEGYRAARLVALSMLASIKRSIGDLDRVRRWHRVFGMVNSAPGFAQQPSVINGFSDLILELYGPARGAHTRSAVGMAELPLHMPVEIEAELSLLS